jgi:hypothetical protein
MLGGSARLIGGGTFGLGRNPRLVYDEHAFLEEGKGVCLYLYYRQSTAVVYS